MSDQISQQQANAEIASAMRSAAVQEATNTAAFVTTRIQAAEISLSPTPEQMARWGVPMDAVQWAGLDP